MDDESSGWISADSMNFAHHQYYQMVALGKKAYAMGGIKIIKGSSNLATNTMERYDEDTNQWTYVASYPHYIYHHCMVADEETGRIWVLGGRVQTGTYQNETHDWSEVRYYQVFILSFAAVLEYNCWCEVLPQPCPTITSSQSSNCNVPTYTQI